MTRRSARTLSWVKSLINGDIRQVMRVSLVGDARADRLAISARVRFSAGTCLANLPLFPRKLELKLSIGRGKASSLLYPRL